MKAKVFLGLAVCFFLISLVLVFGLTTSKGVQAQSQGSPSALPASLAGVLTGGSRNYSYYRLLPVWYLKESDVTTCETWVRLQNTSLVSEIKVGPIYFFDPSGISAGNTIQWDGLRGTTIPPLGSKDFSVSSVPDIFANTYSLAAITWQGVQEALKPLGIVRRYKTSGEEFCVQIVEPF